MSWFKIDDKLHSHKKVARLHGIAPMGLWALAGSWSSNQETDGFIPEYIAERIDQDFAEHAAELVRVGLWEVDEIDGVNCGRSLIRVSIVTEPVAWKSSCVTVTIGELAT